jgi:hypothetical protein
MKATLQAEVVSNKISGEDLSCRKRFLFPG